VSVLHLDFETASRLDLTKVGSSRYSRDASTIVTCMAWAFDDSDIYYTLLPQTLPEPIAEHIRGKGEIHAWNASFEVAILQNFFAWSLLPGQAVCTMQRALHAGLPASLAEAGPALGLASVKDTTARRLMLQMSKPKKDGSWWHDTDAEKLGTLARYCMQDVVAERAIGKVIPELPEREKYVSRLDAETNERGFRIDQCLIHRLIKIADAETRLLNAEVEALTGGYVTSAGTQHQRLAGWLKGKGVPLEGVGKEIVVEALEQDGLDPGVQQVLRIRQKIAKSSVLKLKAMLNTVDADGRCRGTLAYYGAARTGRFSGRLTQPQNFPRPEKYADNAIQTINGYDFGGDALRLFFDEPLSAVASCLRGCLVPTEGQVFFCYDFSQIEARILAWLAGQKDVLKAVRRGIDIYDHTKDKMALADRKAGKAVTLSLGYGMGGQKFMKRARDYGLRPTPEESQRLVDQWRETNSHIVAYWKTTEHLARRALQTGMAGAFQVTKAKNGQPLMTIRLPSGRRLYYRNIRLEPDPERPDRDAITYDGVDQHTRRWSTVRTYGAKLVENITQATARDILVDAALRMHGGAARLVLSVHDELLFEIDPMQLGTLNSGITLAQAFLTGKEVIEMVPHWAEGLPIEATGAILDRYGKP
jgi:DNA polymerase bacteriophage-type